PPAYGTKSLRLTGFLLANLDDSDFYGPAPGITSTFSGGILTISGDSAADVIKVYRADNAGSDYYYTANGVASATFSGVTSIVVNGGDGDDTIDASGVA